MTLITNPQSWLQSKATHLHSTFIETLKELSALPVGQHREFLLETLKDTQDEAKALLDNPKLDIKPLQRSQLEHILSRTVSEHSTLTTTVTDKNLIPIR